MEGTQSFSKLTKFRIGEYSAGGVGAPPIMARTKTYRCVTAHHFEAGGASPIAGGRAMYSLNQYNVPLEFVGFADITADTNLGNRHPSGHPEALALGYDNAIVLAAFYRFTISKTAADNADEQYVFAYRFMLNSSNAEVKLDTKANTIKTWADMRQTRGWVYQRFSGVQSGGSIFPASGVVEIKIEDIPELSVALAQAGTTDEALDWQHFMTIIANSAQDPNKQVFLHICCFYPSGEPMAATDIQVDIECFQTVRLFRSPAAADLIEEADVV